MSDRVAECVKKDIFQSRSFVTNSIKKSGSVAFLIIYFLSCTRSHVGQGKTIEDSLFMYHVVYNKSPLCNPLLKVYNKLSQDAFNTLKTQDHKRSYSNFKVTSPQKFASIGLHLQLGNDHPLADGEYTYRFALTSKIPNTMLTLKTIAYEADSPDNYHAETSVIDGNDGSFGYARWRQGSLGYILKDWPGYKIALKAMLSGKKEYTKIGARISLLPIRIPAIGGYVQQQVFNDTKGNVFIIMHELFSIPAGLAGGSRLTLTRILDSDHKEDVCYLSTDDYAEDKIFASNVDHNFTKP